MYTHQNPRFYTFIFFLFIVFSQQCVTFPCLCSYGYASACYPRPSSLVELMLLKCSGHPNHPAPGTAILICLRACVRVCVPACVSYKYVCALLCVCCHVLRHRVNTGLQLNQSVQLNAYLSEKIHAQRIRPQPIHHYHTQRGRGRVRGREREIHLSLEGQIQAAAD